MQKAILILSLIVLGAAAREFSSKQYQAQTRAVKEFQIMDAVLNDLSSGVYPSPLGLAGIFIEDMGVTMDRVADDMPFLRQKLIHSVGNTGAVEFVAEANTPYTGLFKGASHAIIRLSCAKQADNTKTTPAEAFDNFTPGFGLKFLVDGKPSANLVAMFGVNGVSTWNFFGQDFSNHIPGASGPALTAVANKFATASNHVTTVGLRSFAAFDQSGNSIAKPLFPWRLVFRAPAALKNKYTDSFQQDYQQQLAAIPVGTTLYEVYAIDSPTKTCEVKIGSLILKTKLTTSKFGDQSLFFQHQKMEYDLKDHPEFGDYVSNWKSLFANNDPAKNETACPFKKY